MTKSIFVVEYFERSLKDRGDGNVGVMVGGKELCRYHAGGAGRNAILKALDAIGRSAPFFVTGSFFLCSFLPYEGSSE